MRLRRVRLRSCAPGCEKVAEKETGRFRTEAACLEGAPVVAKTEWIEVEKLETEIKPGEWCAKVKVAKTGNWEEQQCTETLAESEFIKVKIPTFWICREGGTEKYENHLCAKKIETGKWSFLPVEKFYKFTGTSGVSKLETTIAKLRSIIECKKDKITGELGPRGETRKVVITYEECKLFTVSKYVKTEQTTCEVPNIKTNELTDELIDGSGAGPEDKFYPPASGIFAEVVIKPVRRSPARIRSKASRFVSSPKLPWG